jgi:membrane-associated phospholipid phosphatase
MEFFKELFGYAPLILIITSWFVLWDNANLFFYYNIGLFTNCVLNMVLKGLIQQPRPMFDDKKVSLAKTNIKEQFYQNGIPFDIFGMPSGHSQMVFFTTTFIYLSLKHKNLFYFYLITSIIICYQRFLFNYHTITQIIVGSLIGIGYGYFVYQMAREKIKGKIRERKDDYGPI